MISIPKLEKRELWQILAQEPEAVDFNEMSIIYPQSANEYLNPSDLNEYEIINGQTTGYRVERQAFMVRIAIKRLVAHNIKFIQQFYTEGPSFANGYIHHFTQHCLLHTERPQSAEDLLCPRTMVVRMHNYTHSCNNCRGNLYGEAKVVKILELRERSDLVILDLQEIVVVELVHYDGTTITDLDSKFKNVNLRDIKLAKHPFRNQRKE